MTMWVNKTKYQVNSYLTFCCFLQRPCLNFQYTGFQFWKTHAQLDAYYGRMVGEHDFQKKELTMHYFKVHHYLQKILLSFDKILLFDSSKN